MADLLELFCWQMWGDDRRNALTVAVPVKKKGCGLFFYYSCLNGRSFKVKNDTCPFNCENPALS